MSGRIDTPPPDIMVRKRNSKIYLGPETHRGEEWLVANMPPRPHPIDCADTGERIGIRSFVIDKDKLEEVFAKAEQAGMIIRKQPR